MREIKFRAWDELKKQMGVVVGIEWINDGLYVGIQHTDPVSGKYKVGRGQTNSILMQFTGLKDKSGKEIFEGDIVKGNWKVDNIVEVKCENLAEGCKPYNDDYFVNGENTEIIGNVHENPELLTSKEPRG